MKQSEKLDIILKKLYEYQNDGKFYDIENILSQEGIDYKGHEEVWTLVKRLESDGYITRPGNISTHAQLTSRGIDYCEKSSYTFFGHSVITNQYNLSINNSPNAILNNQSPNSIIIANGSTEILNSIRQIKELLQNDNSISQALKFQLEMSTNELTEESKKGEIKKETLKKVLDSASKVSSIGSFVVNLLRAIIGA